MDGVSTTGNYVNLTKWREPIRLLTAMSTINNAQFTNALDYVVVVTNTFAGLLLALYSEADGVSACAGGDFYCEWSRAHAADGLECLTIFTSI